MQRKRHSLWLVSILLQVSCRMQDGAIQSVDAFLQLPQSRAFIRNGFYDNDDFICSPALYSKSVLNINPHWISRCNPLPIMASSRSSSSSSSSSSANREKEIVLEAEALFSESCDADGLMTEDMLSNLPFISELLEDGDLLQQELNQIWNAAAKFPDVDKNVERIDVDSFVQVYRDIDDLFEEEDDEESKENESATMLRKGVSTESRLASDDDDEEEDDDDSNNDDDECMEDELQTIFSTMCDKQGLLSKNDLMKWNEIQKLFSEGLLDIDEFESIWAKARKRPGTTDKLDADGFLSFNIELDGLFDFDDEGEDDDAVNNAPQQNVIQRAAKLNSSTSAVVDGDDLSPEALFDALANVDGFVGMEELKNWGELQDMMDEGDLLPLELESFFEKITNDSGTQGKLDRDGFVMLYTKIKELFEYEEDLFDENKSMAMVQEQSRQQSSRAKEDLVLALKQINEDEDRLPCGLEATEREQKLILNIVAALEADPSNIVRQRQGEINMKDLAGEWELLYSSSSAMAYNKGLSGLGGSFPNGSFGGLKMKLQASKYMTDVEYTERINVVPDSASFDVKVTGGWEIRSSVSIFTGEPSIVLTVVPDRVSYGPTSTRADHWKSLGPTNMLDLTYLDNELRIMRGNTSTETIFVFKRMRDSKK